MRFLNLHTHNFTNSPDILEIVNQYPWDFKNDIPYFSIGIHPWFIKESRLEDDLKIIEDKIQLKNCLALGECGLDNRIELPMTLQIKVFEKQIALAAKFKKPLILHLVGGFDALIEIKKRLKITVPIIIHGFSKNELVAKKLLDEGFYLSFGKYLIQNPKMEIIFKSVPNNRFFLETDTINETIFDVYKLASHYKNTTLEDIKNTINSNFKNVFEIQ